MQIKKYALIFIKEYPYYIKENICCRHSMKHSKEYQKHIIEKYENDSLFG